MWELFGLTPITVWDLPADHFFSMAKAINRIRRERNKK